MNVSEILDELQDQFYDLQNHSSARDIFSENGTLLVLVCYARILPTRIRTVFRILLSFATAYLCESAFQLLYIRPVHILTFFYFDMALQYS